jgi:hypothetical protein
VLVVDDHSSDETVEVASRPGVTVIPATSDSNLGASATRNVGFAAATGDLIALVDADDLWVATHLERVAGLLDEHPQAALAYSRAEKFGDETGPSRRTIPPGIVQDAFATAARVNLSLTCCAVFRREVAVDLGGFDPTIRYGEDFDFWLRLAHRYPVVCTDEITARYRIHSIGKGDTRPAGQHGQITARHRMWTRLREAGDDERSELLKDVMLETWDAHLRAAWQAGNREHFDGLMRLHRLVPESSAARRRWTRKRPLFPARRLWNALPDPVRGMVKSGFRRMKRGG